MKSIAKVMDQVRKCKTHRDIMRMEKALDSMRYKRKAIDKFTHAYALGFLNCVEWSRKC